MNSFKTRDLMVTIHSQPEKRYTNGEKDRLHADANERCTQPSKGKIVDAIDECEAQSKETCQLQTETSCKPTSTKHPECAGVTVTQPCRCPSTGVCEKHEEASRKHDSLNEGFEERTTQKDHKKHKDHLSDSALLALKQAIAGLQQKEHTRFGN